jgi:hypothetical protein
MIMVFFGEPRRPGAAAESAAVPNAFLMKVRLELL